MGGIDIQLYLYISLENAKLTAVLYPRNIWAVG